MYFLEINKAFSFLLGNKMTMFSVQFEEEEKSE